MAVLDTLESLTGIDTDVSIEAVSKEFITAGDNFKSKTVLPLQKYILGIAFLERLGEDIDSEMEEIVDIHNQNRLEYLKKNNPKFVPTKTNFQYHKLSDNITKIINESMLLAPSDEGLAREQLRDVLKWLREEKSKVTKQDSITQIQNYLQR